MPAVTDSRLDASCSTASWRRGLDLKRRVCPAPTRIRQDKASEFIVPTTGFMVGEDMTEQMGETQLELGVSFLY